MCEFIPADVWRDSDLQARKETREKAWQLEGWSETVSKVCDAWTASLSAGD